MRRIITFLAIAVFVFGFAICVYLLVGAHFVNFGRPDPVGGTTHLRAGLTTDDRLRVVFEHAPDGQVGLDELNDRLDRLGFHMAFEVCAEDFDQYVRAHIGEGMVFVPQSATPWEGLFKELLDKGLIGNHYDRIAGVAPDYAMHELVGTRNDPRTLYFMPIWLVFDSDQTSTGAFAGKTADVTEFVSFLEWIGERENYNSFFGAE